MLIQAYQSWADQETRPTSNSHSIMNSSTKLRSPISFELSPQLQCDFSCSWSVVLQLYIYIASRRQIRLTVPELTIITRRENTTMKLIQNTLCVIAALPIIIASSIVVSSDHHRNDVDVLPIEPPQPRSIMRKSQINHRSIRTFTLVQSLTMLYTFGILTFDSFSCYRRTSTVQQTTTKTQTLKWQH